MTDEKMTRMVTGITVGATLLISVLISYAVYQWVEMGVRANRLDALKAEGAALQQQIDEDKDILNGIRSDDEIMTDLAIQNGWVTDNSK